MPEITIPSFVITGLQLILAFAGAFLIALWISLIVWTFRDARRRSRDIFAILLATLMVVIFGPLGVLLYFLLRPPVTLDEIYERSLEEEALLQDLEERPRCPGCSRQVQDAWIICPDCHTTLKNICANCDNTLSLNWNLCPYCGTQVGAAPAPVPQNYQGPSAGQAAVATQQMSADYSHFAPPSSTPEEPQPAVQPEPQVEAEPEQETEIAPAPAPAAPSAPAYTSPSAPTIEQQPISTPPSTRSTRSDETRPQMPEAGPV